MSFKSFMFYIGGFLLSSLFCSESALCSDLQEEEAAERLFFKPILPGSVRSEAYWTYDESGTVTSPQGQEIPLYNQSKLLRNVGKHGLKAVQTLFEQSILRIVEYEDGTFGLNVNLQLLGGGNGGSSEGGSSGGDRSDRSCRVGDNCNTSRSQSLSSSSDTRDRGSDRSQGSIPNCNVASSSDKYCNNWGCSSETNSRDREITQRTGELKVTICRTTVQNPNYGSSSPLSSGNDTRDGGKDRSISNSGNIYSTVNNFQEYAETNSRLHETLEYFKGKKTQQYTGLTKLQEEEIISTAQAICLKTGQIPDSGPLKEAYKQVILFPPLLNIIDYFIRQGASQYTDLSEREKDKILRKAMENCFQNNIKNPDSGPLKEAYKEVMYSAPLTHTLEWFGRDKLLGGAGLGYFTVLTPDYERQILSIGKELAYKGNLTPDSGVIQKAYTQVMTGQLKYVFDYHKGQTQSVSYVGLHPIQEAMIVKKALEVMKVDSDQFFNPDTAPLSQALRGIHREGWNPYALDILQVNSNPRVLHNTKGAQSVFNERNGLVYPLLNKEVTSTSDLLIRDFFPEEDHENLGLSFLQATGRDTLEILEHVLGIPQVHASVGLLEIQNTGGLQNVLATYGGTAIAMENQAIQTMLRCHPYALVVTAGFALDTMLNNGELSQFILEGLQRGWDRGYENLGYLGLLNNVVTELLRKGLGSQQELKKLENILVNTAPGDPNGFEPDDSGDEEEQDFKWEVKDNNSASKVSRHPRFGKFYKDPIQKVGNKNIWWSKDQAGHGGSRFKLFKEYRNELRHFADIDAEGNVIPKHKGPIGRDIPRKELIGIK